MLSPVVILGGARTPIGNLSGLLISFAATERGGFAIRGAAALCGGARHLDPQHRVMNVRRRAGEPLHGGPFQAGGTDG
jgi:hypothetical protein